MELIINTPNLYIHLQDAILVVQYIIDGLLHITSNIEFHNSKIKVQVVNPGSLKTPMTDKNPFFMPFLMTPQNAAKKIYEKLESKQFEIYFPKKLVIPMKLLRLLPYSIYFFLIKKLIKLP